MTSTRYHIHTQNAAPPPGGYPAEFHLLDRDACVNGENVNAAKYDPEDSDYLLESEPSVAHYEVVSVDTGNTPRNDPSS